MKLDLFAVIVAGFLILSLTVLLGITVRDPYHHADFVTVPQWIAGEVDEMVHGEAEPGPLNPLPVLIFIGGLAGLALFWHPKPKRRMRR